MGTLPWYRTRPMAIVSPMPAKAEPSWFRPPDAACPTVGANCRRTEDNIPEEGTSRRGEDGAIGRRLQVGGRTGLPSFGTQTRWPGLLLLVWYYNAKLQVQECLP